MRGIGNMRLQARPTHVSVIAIGECARSQHDAAVFATDVLKSDLAMIDQWDRRCDRVTVRQLGKKCQSLASLGRIFDQWMNH